MVKRPHRVAEVGHVPRAALQRLVERRNVGLGVPERDEEAALHEGGDEVEPARDLGGEGHHRPAGKVSHGLEEGVDASRIAPVEQTVAVKGARPVRRDERSFEVNAERHRPTPVSRAARANPRGEAREERREIDQRDGDERREETLDAPGFEPEGEVVEIGVARRQDVDAEGPVDVKVDQSRQLHFSSRLGLHPGSSSRARATFPFFAAIHSFAFSTGRPHFPETSATGSSQPALSRSRSAGSGGSARTRPTMSIARRFSFTFVGRMAIISPL